MESDGTENTGINTESAAAVNSLILDYYKKFGRKRDLEQFFSLSTADSEVSDVTSLFWRRMKSQDSSDSGEKKSESSTELCRISIKCSVPEPNSSQDETTKTKSDSESPPIITEDQESRHSDEDSINEDNHSQKSMDAILDTSINKPLSPSSSITSQRKLEWDSLADVGYANESDRKTSASSLSTLERLALKQQYTNNDSKENIDIGTPTAHSTMVDVTENKCKQKKGAIRKTTKIYQKDVDVVEVSMPHGAHTSPSQAINVNLTKHISFNMDKDGSVKVENLSKELNVTPEDKSAKEEENFVDIMAYKKIDKEMQTSLIKTTEKSVNSDIPQSNQIQNQKIPVLISLNTLRKRYKKKLRVVRKKLKNKKKIADDKENIPVQEKSTEQVSAAESFEYLPGHVYNQNKLHQKQPREQLRSLNNTDNKSSLESSGVPTTESSKDSKHSFTKDLEKSIELLKLALHKKHNDSELKNKLIKELVQRLLKAKYRDDDSSTDFLSGLSFNSKKLGLGKGNVTSSTSDSNNTDTMPKLHRPKKSILRLDKFNSNNLASTSQSAPNLHSVIASENPLNHIKPLASNNETDVSSGKHSSDTAFAKTSSEELYQKYLEALKREEAYKKHLRDKQMFLKHKLAGSEPIKVQSMPQVDSKVNDKLKELINDLTRNNYDDGSGDASKLERGSSMNLNFNKYNALPKQKSHSVFTLSSGNSDENRKANLRKRMQNELRESKAVGRKEEGHCFCHHQCGAQRFGVVDSSVQVNIRNESQEIANNVQRPPCQITSACGSRRCSHESSRNVAHVLADDVTGEIKYVCLCNEKMTGSEQLADNMLIFKCSRLNPKENQLEDTISKASHTIGIQCMGNCLPSNHSQPSTSSGEKPTVSCYIDSRRLSKSSQTQIDLAAFDRKSSDDLSASNEKTTQPIRSNSENSNTKSSLKNMLQEATRCIQTEISIDPKISDPSLSDINYVNNNTCIEPDKGKYIPLSKQDLESNDKNTMLNSCSKSNTASQITESSARSDFKKQTVPESTYPASVKSDQNFQSVLEPNNNEIQLPGMPKTDNFMTDNFTIPIQGTNMTLMVKIGSKSNNIVNYENTAAETDKIEITEKATSLREECTKGVQSQVTDTFTSKVVEVAEYADGKKPLENSKQDVRLHRKGNIFPLDERVSIKNKSGAKSSHTYPKASSASPKPILRSNTDSGKFLSGLCLQTDKNNAAPQRNTRKTDYQSDRSKEDDSIKSDSQSDQSKAGASAKSDCHSDQPKESAFDNNAKNKTSLDKSERDIEIKNSLTDTQSSKSSSESYKDPILDVIKDIKKRYSKKDIEKSKKKKCFKEIISLLNYLLDTEEGTTNSFKYSGTSNSLVTECDNVQCTCNKDKSRCRCNENRNEKQEPKKMLRKMSKEEKKESIVPKSSSKAMKERADSPPSVKSQTENSSYECGGKNPKCNESKKDNKSYHTTEDKGVQSSPKITKRYLTDSSEVQATTEFTETSTTDSATCKILNKIKRECEKYHQKRCKGHMGKKCEASSSTSINCERCKRVHHCHCRNHKCHSHKTKTDKVKKKCVAYNLIIQTSDSMISEETTTKNFDKPLPNIVVRVPSKCKKMDKAPFAEVYTKIEKAMPYSSNPRGTRVRRSRSLPNESEVSSDDHNRCCTVQDYLELNRPDFVKKSSTRQQCLREIYERRTEANPYPPRPTKMVVVHSPARSSPGPCNVYCGGAPTICCCGTRDNCEPFMQCLQDQADLKECVINEYINILRANQREAQRKLVSAQLDQRPSLTSLSETDLRRLAKELGVDTRRKKLDPKFISEREMKQHSEKIYKSLPEVVSKKEERKKENIKKTNLLMANIFKKNLQMKTLRGAVNLSNYSNVIKI